MASPAAKEAAPTSGIDALVKTAKSKFFPHKSGEDRLLLAFIVLSGVVHLFVLLVGDLSWLRDKPPLSDEWTMDADLVTDIDMLAPPPKAALPKAEIAPEPKVPQELLPQLPKKVSVKEDTKTEEAIAEKKEEEKDAKIAEKEQKAEDLKLKTETKDDNQLTQKELLKRLAMERLRQEDKTAPKTEAPEADPLARLAQELNKNSKKSKTFASAAGKGNQKKYLGLLAAAVRRNYQLPEVYNLKGADMKVLFDVTLSERGDLLNVEMRQSSGDSVFDDATMQAIRASAPLPPPPADLVGVAIPFQFTP